MNDNNQIMKVVIQR